MKMMTLPSLELELIEEINQLKFYEDGSGAMMVFGPSKGIPDEVINLKNLCQELNFLSEQRGLPLLNVMINKLDPGVHVGIHRDWIHPTQFQNRKAPTIERWHLPVVTNPACLWWGKNTGKVYFKPLLWTGPVPYWEPHSVWNTGDTVRIHVVVDLDTPELLGEYRD